MRFELKNNLTSCEIICISNGIVVARLFYYGENDSVGIEKYTDLTKQERISLFYFIKKALKNLNPVIAYCSQSDSRTNKLLLLLGFSLQNQKMDYNLYSNG
jgi:hypothetical protein